MDVLLALLLYPGLLAMFFFCIVIAFFARMPLPRLGLLGTLRQSRYGILALLSIALAVGASLLTPWPLHPADRPPVGNLLYAWILIEAAALLPLLPGLASVIPLAVRAASREAQVGFAGRSVCWLAIVVAGYAGSAVVDLPGSLLALLAGLLALLAATGLGPFGPEQSLEPEHQALGLDDLGVALLPLARLARMVALLGLLTSAVHPLSAFGPLGAVAFTLLCAIGCGLILQWSSTIPRLTLPAGISWCWWQALPFALAGLVYLIVT